MESKVELFTKDTKTSSKFYQDMFGFEIVKKNQGYIGLKKDSVRIAIDNIEGLSDNHYFNPEIKNQRKGLGVEIVFEVENIEETYALFKEYPIESELKQQPWGKKDFRIKDPDGYYIRVTTTSQ